jgi:hypothetical protein
MARGTKTLFYSRKNKTYIFCAQLKLFAQKFPTQVATNQKGSSRGKKQQAGVELGAHRLFFGLSGPDAPT